MACEPDTSSERSRSRFDPISHLSQSKHGSIPPYINKEWRIFNRTRHIRDFAKNDNETSESGNGRKDNLAIKKSFGKLGITSYLPTSIQSVDYQFDVEIGEQNDGLKLFV